MPSVRKGFVVPVVCQHVAVSAYRDDHEGGGEPEPVFADAAGCKPFVKGSSDPRDVLRNRF